MATQKLGHLWLPLRKIWPPLGRNTKMAKKYKDGQIKNTYVIVFIIIFVKVVISRARGGRKWRRLNSNWPEGQRGASKMTDDKDETAESDDYFGIRPHCHKNDGYVNVGAEHWFYCKEHKIRWCSGFNIFSSWEDETEAQQCQQYDELGFGSYQVIREWHGGEIEPHTEYQEFVAQRRGNKEDNQGEVPF
jgi:hypothetical protein